jgi:short-subunit dehydrogenase
MTRGLLAELGLVSPIEHEGSTAMPAKPLAVVTGASSGIGYELAKCCALGGFDLVIAADDDAGLDNATARLRECGAEVAAVKADLATAAGVEALYASVKQTPVDALLANAGHGLGGAFMDQSFDDIGHVVNTNITGTLDLVQRIGRNMVARGSGRIMFTGSIAGFMPGTYQAVYNGTKAFIDSFAFALRNELKDTGVTVTCLMPGATETDFFERADMLDTRIGTQKKSDPADVAKAGYEAMMKGEGEVITGWMNKMRAAISAITPASAMAEQHRKMAAPGTGKR